MYPFLIEYWPTLLDYDAHDNHKRSIRITIDAKDARDAKLRFKALHIPHVHLIVHEPILR